MRILVTGGAGFVGRHLIKRLLQEPNNTIVCVDNLTPGTGGIHPKDWLPKAFLDSKNFEFINLDCREYFRSQVCDFDEIFHLAAIVGGRAVIEGNPILVASDLAIDSDMWNFTATNSQTKVINFSSSAAYPVSLQKSDTWRALSESDIDFEKSQLGKPDLSYGWAKLTTEFLGKLAFESKGIRSVTYRPFSGYGHDQDINYPFRAICSRALSLSKESNIFEVWGTGNQIRDFIHIEDCITGILQTKDKISDGSPINLGTGIGTSFKTLASLILEELEREDIEVVGLSDKPEGVFARVADTTFAESLGFKANKTLAQGVRESLQVLKLKNS